MKWNLIRISSAVVAVLLLLTMMTGALAASSSSTVEVAPGTTEVTYTLTFDQIASQYASAQFDVTISDKTQLDVKSITYSSAILSKATGMADTLSTGGSLTGNKVLYQAGFLSTANQFGAESSICTLTLSYTGSASTSVTFDNLRVWRLEGTSGSQKLVESSISGWQRSVVVTRGSSIATGSSGGTASTGTTGSGVAGTKDIAFTDVHSGDWFYSAVQYVVNAELMTGTTATAFEPETAMSRAMFVTVLYRLAGSPEVTGTSAFSDVEIGKWYSEAVLWATQTGVVTGYDSKTFGTNDALSKEQLLAMLYRYASNKGYDVSTGQKAELQAFSDASVISSYAVTAYKWAYGASIVGGSSATTLDPLGVASRAVCARIMMGFMEKYTPSK